MNSKISIHNIAYLIHVHVYVLGFSKMLLPIIRVKETDALSANE